MSSPLLRLLYLDLPICLALGPGMENQSIPLGPFNESTMWAKLFESKKGGPFIRVASYHKGSMSNDKTVSLKVNNRFLELEIHTAADWRSYRLEIMEERGSELYLIVNATIIIAPACEDPAIPADNRTLNETTERNTTKRVSRVRRVRGAMGNFKDWILGLMPFTNWCKNEGPVHDSAKEGDLNGNAEVQLSCNLERVTVQPGNAREEVPLLDNTQSLGTDKV